jgi:hypothetical protein
MMAHVRYQPYAPGLGVALIPNSSPLTSSKESPPGVGPAGFLCEWSYSARLNMIVPVGGRRCFLITLLRILLVGLVASDDAPGNRADFAVARHMAREAPNNGALNASLRLGRSGSESDSENGGTNNQ